MRVNWNRKVFNWLVYRKLMDYRRRKQIGKKYSSVEIIEAIKKFRESGGLIKKLPDQKIPIKREVRPKKMENSSGYESLRFEDLNY